MQILTAGKRGSNVGTTSNAYDCRCSNWWDGWGVDEQSQASNCEVRLCGDEKKLSRREFFFAPTSSFPSLSFTLIIHPPSKIARLPFSPLPRQSAMKTDKAIDEEEFKKNLKKPLVKVSNIQQVSTCFVVLDHPPLKVLSLEITWSHSLLLNYSLLSSSIWFPTIQYSDLPTEMGNDVVDIATMAIDKFQSTNDYESASALIKNSLDKKFGPSWQCAVGEGFGFDISCQQKYLLHLYYGKVGILCYKS